MVFYAYAVENLQHRQSLLCVFIVIARVSGRFSKYSAALEPPAITVGSELPLVVANVASALSLEVLLEYVFGFLEQSC